MCSSDLILALSLAFQMTSFPQTRRGLNWQEGIRFLGLNLPGALGFGVVLLVALSIPVVGALCLPAAVIAGTRFYALGRKPASGR